MRGTARNALAARQVESLPPPVDIVTLKLALIPGRGEDRVAAEISHAAMIFR